jgi:hypothetical protein
MYGLSRVSRTDAHRQRHVAMGTGVDNTVYFDNGCEMPRFTMWIPPSSSSGRPAPLPAPSEPRWTRIRIAARPDGSELVSIAGWGVIELWPAEGDVRNAWADLGAGGAETVSMGFFWITHAETGGFYLWIVREDRLEACAADRWNSAPGN